MIGFEFSIMRQSVWLTLCSMGCCAMKPRISPELDIERPLSEAANYRFGSIAVPQLYPAITIGSPSQSVV